MLGTLGDMLIGFSLGDLDELEELDGRLSA
jgi:hypothetical protein